MTSPSWAVSAGSGIGAGRLAWVDDEDDANQADLAIVAMLEEAQRSVKISQQDIGPVQLPVLGMSPGQRSSTRPLRQRNACTEPDRRVIHVRWSQVQRHCTSAKACASRAAGPCTSTERSCTGSTPR